MYKLAYSPPKEGVGSKEIERMEKKYKLLHWFGWKS